MPTLNSMATSTDPYKCDHCGLSIHFCDYTVIMPETKQEEGFRYIPAKVRCEHCGEYSQRVTKLVKK